MESKRVGRVTPLPTTAAPEFEILCLAVRANPDLSEIANAVKSGVDWVVLFNLAAAHAVRPQLFHALRALNWISVPVEMKQSLLDFWKVHKARSLLAVSELIRLSHELSQRTIRFATFKGPSLAAGLYGDPSLREYEDIDLIVDERRLVETESVLNTLGYRAVDGGSAFRYAFLSYQRQFAFVREMPSFAIDLHWDFVGSHVPFPIRPKEIWSNLEEVDIGGWGVPTLGKSDLALLLAGHGTKEGWRRLSWVGDLAMFIEKYPDLDWGHLLTRAQQRGCGQSLLLGARLVYELLGAAAKIDFHNVAKDRKQLAFKAKTVLHRIRNEIPASVDRDLLDFELCTNGFQKARALGELLFARTTGDYAAMPLPRPFWRVYHVTRPFRLASKTITGSLNLKNISERLS
jgi:Uncharacterised nucleotidyltransferase